MRSSTSWDRLQSRDRTRSKLRQRFWMQLRLPADSETSPTKKGIYILRQNPGGGESRIAFNYKKVIKGKNPQQNIKLEPRDTIVVP